MKKVFLAFAVVALIGLASCSKNKVCHCYYDYTSPLGNGTQDLGLSVIHGGSCTDLETNGTYSTYDFGDLGTGKVRCEKVK